MALFQNFSKLDAFAAVGPSQLAQPMGGLSNWGDPDPNQLPDNFEVAAEVVRGTGEPARFVGDANMDAGGGISPVYNREGSDKFYGMSGNEQFASVAGDFSKFEADVAGGPAHVTQPVGDLSDLVADPNPDQPLPNPEIPVQQVRGTGDEPTRFIGNTDHTIKGSDASEIITGHDDNFFGFGGNDRINAGGGNDTVYGREGNDIISGGEGNDNLYGMSGNDQIAGGTGDDTISGGPGNDRLFGEQGADTISGGTGNDLLSGGSGNDTLKGGPGNDSLDGGYGNDWLQGGSGNDFLKGGRGADVMTGGAGSDRFFFGSTQDSLNLYGKSDLITDFQHGMDKLHFSMIDANELVAGNDAFTLVDYTGPDQILGAGQMTAYFDPVSGRTIVEANIDGDASNEFRLELAGDVGLNFGDMIL